MTTVARAEPPDCKPQIDTERKRCQVVLDQCDKTIAAKDKALELSDLAIKDCVKANGELQTQVNNTNDQLSAWYRNPFIMFGIGVLAGGVTYGLLKK